MTTGKKFGRGIKHEAVPVQVIEKSAAFPARPDDTSIRIADAVRTLNRIKAEQGSRISFMIGNDGRLVVQLMTNIEG